MEEETKVISDEEPTDTTPAENFCVPVKFNKEIRNLTVKEAALLSQKGLKFDSISGEFERLAAFAREERISVSAFLDRIAQTRTQQKKEELVKQCGGNEEIAEHIMNLEKKADAALCGETEFSAYFPSVPVSSLPDEVIENAKRNHTSVLDEYLRYGARVCRAAGEAEQQKKNNKRSAVGSLKDGGTTQNDPGQLEFVKAIWA